MSEATVINRECVELTSSPCRCKDKQNTALCSVSFKVADLKGSYGDLVRDHNTQVKFHFGVMDLDTGPRRANPLSRSVIIGSDISDLFENFKMCEMT